MRLTPPSELSAPRRAGSSQSSPSDMRYSMIAGTDSDVPSQPPCQPGPAEQHVPETTQAGSVSAIISFSEPSPDHTYQVDEAYAAARLRLASDRILEML